MFDINTKILIVDDMMTMRKLVMKALKDIGFSQFSEAADGVKAWELLSQPSSDIKLVISDWNMPNCTGLDLLKRVRSEHSYKTIPFILLTAESEISQVAQAIQAGVSSYITKPFSPDVLKKKLTEVHAKMG